MFAIGEKAGHTLIDSNHNLDWSVSDHQSSQGKWFSQRYAGLSKDVENASRAGLWQYFRSHSERVAPRSVVFDEAGREFSGTNLGSQDYLGLASHPEVHKKAIEAIKKFGVHSSGSAPMGGGSLSAKRLADTISSTLDVKHTLLFPTGWSAGYGAITGIVRQHDYVVMDALAHNCLQHGANAATPNVVLFIHNSLDSLRKRLQRLRSKEPDAAILVVFESLYSMDSDAPNIEEFIRTAREYEAHVLVDIAHDLGVLGRDGRGLLADHGGYASADIVIGSFSKVFASIGGFISSNDVNLVRAIQGFSGSYTFSNFLIPPQIAAAQAAFDIAFSREGDSCRAQVLQACRTFRTLLEMQGFETYGLDSAMIILKVGNERTARDAYRRILDQGVIVNCIEFPAVRKGEARFRIQLTPQHNHSDLVASAGVIADSIRSAEKA